MLKYKVFLELDAISTPSPRLQWANKEKSKQETVLDFCTQVFYLSIKDSLITMKDVANNSIVFFPLLWFDIYIEKNTLLNDKPKPN